MWTSLRFRSTDQFELKRLDDLTPEQKQAFVELEADGDFYGLLVPRPGVTMNVKSVGTQAASLFRELSTPAVLDSALTTDEESRNDVIDLVLDGVLEIESDGEFLSGADAFPLFQRNAPPLAGGSAIARLSVAALEHAEDLVSDDATALANALYAYNRIPLTRFWLTRFATRAAVLSHIGADDGQTRGLLERFWTMSPEDPASFWISWRSNEHRRRPRGGATYKLYVSPRPEHIREAFQALVRVLADIPGAQFKIGPDATGLLRPDKLVAYFNDREELDQSIAALRPELSGCPAHGIPFTAGVDGDGLLSWGMDPPESERALSWQQRESWRLWVAVRLGAALAIAKRSRRRSVAPSRFAVERVRRQGVDVDTWTPSASWRASA